MNRHFLFPLLLFFLSMLPLSAESQDNFYPTPERLFHIARSVNKNLVCYDVNLESGKWDSSTPLKVYWINREEHEGLREELNFIQRKMAYGYKVKKTTPTSAICTLSAYPKRPITIQKTAKGFQCLIEINHQQAVLQSLFVKASPKNPLKVLYVELHGVSLSNHQPLSERILNQ